MICIEFFKGVRQKFYLDSIEMIQNDIYHTFLWLSNTAYCWHFGRNTIQWTQWTAISTLSFKWQFSQPLQSMQLKIKLKNNYCRWKISLCWQIRLFSSVHSVAVPEIQKFVRGGSPMDLPPGSATGHITQIYIHICLPGHSQNNDSAPTYRCGDLNPIRCEWN